MIKLDRINLNILKALQNNATLSNLKLAEQVGLSASPCHERVKRLETSGVIKGYRMDIDLSKITPHVVIFSEITMRNHSYDEFRAFEKRIKTIPEIVECFKISGAYDYLLRFVCRDMVHYHDLTETMIDQDMGIDKLVSLVTLDMTKSLQPVPLETLLKDDEDIV